ncbi:hypothetical protein CEXT_490481 [Caerostris extrusa]|uniref:Uncharacterized protein n=1 Tax=Caerostris extrusa TaxID=172846 RepID=A0AAV4XVQ1_CAEEX|nr:hypothetical protein CEXT_490481 [Caerostris extrusa]
MTEVLCWKRYSSAENCYKLNSQVQWPLKQSQEKMHQKKNSDQCETDLHSEEDPATGRSLHFRECFDLEKWTCSFLLMREKKILSFLFLCSVLFGGAHL